MDGLMPENSINLSEQERRTIKRIFEYDISFVYERLLADKAIEKEDIPQLNHEFRKFITLAGLGIYPIAMISPLIDEVWHQFILFTKHYKEFCLSTVGHFIGHMPDTSLTPIPPVAGKNFMSGYMKYFGELPPIWFKNMDQASLNYYAQADFTYAPPKRWSGFAGPE